MSNCSGVRGRTYEKIIIIAITIVVVAVIGMYMFNAEKKAKESDRLKEAKMLAEEARNCIMILSRT